MELFSFKIKVVYAPVNIRDFNCYEPNVICSNGGLVSKIRMPQFGLCEISSLVLLCSNNRCFTTAVVQWGWFICMTKFDIIQDNIYMETVKF